LAGFQFVAPSYFNWDLDAVFSLQPRQETDFTFQSQSKLTLPRLPTTLSIFPHLSCTLEKPVSSPVFENKLETNVSEKP